MSVVPDKHNSSTGQHQNIFCEAGKRKYLSVRNKELYYYYEHKYYYDFYQCPADTVKNGYVKLKNLMAGQVGINAG